MIVFLFQISLQMSVKWISTYLHFYPLEIICCYTYTYTLEWNGHMPFRGNVWMMTLCPTLLYYNFCYCYFKTSIWISIQCCWFNLHSFLVPQQMWSKISFLNFLTPLCQFTVLLLLFLVSTKSYELLGIVVVLWRSLWLFLNLINTDTKWSQKIVPRCKMLQWLDLKEK